MFKHLDNYIDFLFLCHNKKIGIYRFNKYNKYTVHSTNKIRYLNYLIENVSATLVVSDELVHLYYGGY